MTTTVWPIAMSFVNWPTLLKEAEAMLGYSLEHPVQRSSFSLNDAPSFIIALGELEEQGSTKNRLPSHNARLLQHTMVSFLVYAEPETFIELFEKSVLTITRSRSGRVSIISGTLLQWSDAVTYSVYVRNETRIVIDKIYQCLVAMKLNDLV